MNDRRNLPPFVMALVGKALFDKEFRHDLLANPEYVANQMGIYLTPNQVENLKSLNPEEVDAKLQGSGEPIEDDINTMTTW